MPMTQCPFCSDPNYLAAFTKGKSKKVQVPLPLWHRQEKFWSSDMQKSPNYLVTLETEKRGDLLRTVLKEEDFRDPWRDFIVEVFGVESIGEPLLPTNNNSTITGPPAPFFFLSTVFQGESLPFLYRQFFACRITHKGRDISLVVHWWVSHGRLMHIHGPLSLGDAKRNLKMIKESLDFFQPEARGNPKLGLENVLDAYRRAGYKATQKAVAKELQVTEQALERWRKRFNLSTWREVTDWFDGSGITPPYLVPNVNPENLNRV